MPAHQQAVTIVVICNYTNTPYYAIGHLASAYHISCRFQVVKVKEPEVKDDPEEPFRHLPDSEIGVLKRQALTPIHVFARTHWTNWHARFIASNSAPLQVFLYLCEKRRLQALETKDAEGDGGYYEALLGALLEDPRVAPAILMNNRPRTVQQCIDALQKWCHMPTTMWSFQ